MFYLRTEPPDGVALGTIVLIMFQIKVNNLTWFYTNYGNCTEDALEAKTGIIFSSIYEWS